MKVSEVTKEDAQQIGQVIQALQAGEWKIGVKDAVALVDGVRWLQKMAVEMAKELQKPVAAPAAPVPAPAPTSEPAPAAQKAQAFENDKADFVVTSYTPGKLGKGKK